VERRKTKPFAAWREAEDGNEMKNNRQEPRRIVATEAGASSERGKTEDRRRKTEVERRKTKPFAAWREAEDGNEMKNNRQEPRRIVATEAGASSERGKTEDRRRLSREPKANERRRKWNTRSWVQHWGMCNRGGYSILSHWSQPTRFRGGECCMSVLEWGLWLQLLLVSF
jgi:hypothetical protein